MNVSTLATSLENNDLTLLSDELDDPNTLKNWLFFHDDEGWPNRIKKIDVDKKRLVIESQIGCWVADLQGIFLFKQVKGDFIVSVRAMHHWHLQNNNILVSEVTLLVLL